MGFFNALFAPAWEKAVRRADRCERGADPGGAIAALDDALRLAPEDARDALVARRSDLRRHLAALHLDAAREHERIGDEQTARERFALAAEFAEDEETREVARNRLAVLEQAEANAEEARRAGMAANAPDAVSDEELLVALTAAFPEDMQEAYEAAPAALRQAAAALQQGRAEEALAHFEAHPPAADDPLALFEYGRTLLHVGQAEAALEALRRSDEEAPGWIPVKLARAEAALEADRVEEAEEVLQEAHDIDPEDLNVYVAICRTALRSSDPAYGLEAAAVVLERHPGHREMVLLKGRILEAMGRLDDAWTIYDSAVHAGFRYDATSGTLNTDRAASQLLVACTLRRGKGHDRAEQVLRTLGGVLEGAELRRVKVLLVAILRSAGRDDEAAEVAGELREQAEAASDTGVLLALAAMNDDSAEAARLEATLTPEQRDAWSADRERFFAPAGTPR